MKGGRVTQKDIAEALNISPITVHRALNRTGYVSEELRAQIISYADKVNYVPHKASQVLVRNKLHKLALFSSDQPKHFWNEIGNGIDLACRQILPFDFLGTYYSIPDGDSRRYMASLEEALDNGVEAVGVVNQWVYDMNAVFRFLDERGVPYITLNIDAPESRRLSFIGPDYPAGGRLAAEFIARSLSHAADPKVAVINELANKNTDSLAPDINGQRLSGFVAKLRDSLPEAEVSVHELAEEASSPGLEEQIAAALIGRLEEIDAVYLIPPYNKVLADALRSTESKRLPIVVVHDIDPSTDDYFDNNLVSAVVYQDPILQGYYAVRTLEQIIETGTSPSNDHIDIVHSLILSENRHLFRNDYHFTHLNQAT